MNLLQIRGFNIIFTGEICIVSLLNKVSCVLERLSAP